MWRLHKLYLPAQDGIREKMCSLAFIKIKQSYSVSLGSPRSASLEQDLENDLKREPVPTGYVPFSVLVRNHTLLAV